MSGAMQKCPDDHPLMIAWKAYQDTEDFKNTFKWATSAILISTQETAPEANRVDPIEARERRAMGTLWGAFMAGFNVSRPTREQIITEIMKLVRPHPTRREKPTIAELEAILNSETTDAIDINPDGSVSARPSSTTVGAVADAILGLRGAQQGN